MIGSELVLPITSLTIESEANITYLVITVKLIDKQQKLKFMAKLKINCMLMKIFFLRNFLNKDSKFSHSQFSHNSQFHHIFAAYQLDVYC